MSIDRDDDKARRGNTGIAVDAHGGPVIDPTENVIALSKAANARQDDLRHETNARIDAELSHVKEMMDLRAEHAREIREIESNRLNAIRQVDVLAVNTAADRALAAIQTLAATTTANADTLRAMVANTATTIATQTAGVMQTVNDRLATLERSSYEGKGRSAFADPALAEMLTELRKLGAAQATVQGKHAGINASWAMLIGSAGLIVTLVTISQFFHK